MLKGLLSAVFAQLAINNAIPYDWPTLPAVRGYVPRPCGFDLNDNGIIGESADCQICNGIGGQILDIDGDGVNETQYYVDCQHGSDTTTCGSPLSPCRSINYTWTARASGPTPQGGEDIICFTGVCVHESHITPGVSGGNTVRTKSISGSEQWPFEFATNPTILCGWDRNQNGQYPPYDTQDTSVIDGSMHSLTRFLDVGINGYAASFVEMAHFEVTGYGTFIQSADDKGFMKMGSGTSTNVTHWHHHDLRVFNVNREVVLVTSQSSSTISLWNWFTSNVWKYYAVINCEFIDYSHYGMRGGTIPASLPPLADQHQFIRFQNNLFRPFCSGKNSGEFSTTSKMWGMHNFWEFIDNVFDGNVGEFGPNKAEDNGRLTGILVNECQQNILMRNNYFYNFYIPMAVTGYTTGYCDIRPTTGIVMDHNIVFHDTNYWRWSLGNGVRVTDDQNDVPFIASIQNVTVSYNIFNATAPANWQTIFEFAVGNEEKAHGGIIDVHGNHAWVTSTRSGFGVFVFGDVGKADDIPYPQENYAIYDNFIYGLTGDAFNDKHVLVHCVNSACPTSVSAHGNVYSACSDFEVNTVDYLANEWEVFRTTKWGSQDSDAVFCGVGACNASNDVGGGEIVQGADSASCASKSAAFMQFKVPMPSIVRNGFNARPLNYTWVLLGISQNSTPSPPEPPNGGNRICTVSKSMMVTMTLVIAFIGGNN